MSVIIIMTFPGQADMVINKCWMIAMASVQLS